MNTLVITADSSPTLFSEEYNQIYHSNHGAISEGVHVFIENGLEKLKHLESINVFEMGFGTGLNAILAKRFSHKYHKNIYYETIEKHPLVDSSLDQVKVHLPEFKEDFEQIHASEWNNEVKLSDFFVFHKVENSLEKYVFNKKFDIIFFDAFSPNSQPELWTEEVFINIYHALNPNGFLVTYCAKGIVKRTLRASGFEVHTLPGPPRKREMVMAVKV